LKKISYFYQDHFREENISVWGGNVRKKFLVKTLDLTPWLFPKLHKMYFNKNFYFENNVTISSEKDLFGLVEYMMSQRAGYITGQDFVVDGGWLAKGF